jgi:glycosyltransferase involved in cell wall biosynthesis
MKVLLINDYATDAGGAELQMHGLRSELRRRGHDARLFSTTADSHTGHTPPDYQCFGTTSSFRTLLQTANPWAARHLSDVIADFEPDVAHVMMFLTQLSPLILPALRRVPCVYNVVWHRPVCPLGTKMLPDGSLCKSVWGTPCYREGCLPIRDWIPLMAQMTLFRHWDSAVDLFLANSHAIRRELIDEGLGPVEVLWHGTPVVEACDPLHEVPTAAFVGRLVPEKGVDVLIQAFGRILRELPHAQLVIIGDGPERAHLERLIASMNLSGHVTLRGHLARADAERAVQGCWVQVAPSRWSEPFGVVAIEAQMRGTAVIASRIGGFSETVEDGRTGVLVAPGDADALHDALLQLLRSRERAEALGQAGRERAVALFSERRIVDQLIGFYENVVDRHVNAHA